MKEARWELVTWTYSYGEETREETYYAYVVHIFKNGKYTGEDIFCKTFGEAKAFAIKCNCAKFTRMETGWRVLK